MVRALTGRRNQQELWPAETGQMALVAVDRTCFEGPERGRGERRYALRRRAMCPGWRRSTRSSSSAVSPRPSLCRGSSSQAAPQLFIERAGSGPGSPAPRAGRPRSRRRSLRANRRRGSVARWPVGCGPRRICSPRADGVAARTPDRVQQDLDSGALFVGRDTGGGDQPAAAINPRRVPAISRRRPGRRESRPGSRRSRRSARSWRRSGAARRPRRRTAPRGSRMPSPGR